MIEEQRGPFIGGMLVGGIAASLVALLLYIFVLDPGDGPLAMHMRAYSYWCGEEAGRWEEFNKGIGDRKSSTASEAGWQNQYCPGEAENAELYHFGDDP